MPFRRFQHLFTQLRLSADLMKVNQPQQHILPAPDIPALKFFLSAVSGNPAVRLLAGQQLLYRLRENAVQLLVPGILPGHAGAPHKLPPVFSPPSVICIIRCFRKLLCDQLPQLSVLQLLFFCQTNHLIRNSPVNCSHHYALLWV